MWTIVWKSSPPCIDLSSFSLPPGYLSMKIVCVKRPQVCLGRTLDRNKEKRLSRVSFYRLIHRSIELFAPGKSILYSSLSARRLFNRRKIHKKKNSEKTKKFAIFACNFIAVMSFICYIKSIHRFLSSTKFWSILIPPDNADKSVEKLMVENKTVKLSKFHSFVRLEIRLLL